MEQKKKQASFPWLLSHTGAYRGRYTISVIMAAIGVICSVAPFFIVAGIIRELMSGNQDFNYYLGQCLLMTGCWAVRVLAHAVSTSCSHRATFQVLANLRKKCTDKLAKVPLGTVMDQSSGALKNILVERIDSIETTLAHILPEFTGNLLAPICVFIYIFTIDWRMAFAALLTVPVGLLCYMGMMIGYEKKYKRAITATKNLNDTAVEYINGIEVIKVFGKAESSYERFVNAAREAADSYVSWMRSNNGYFTFAMNVMPASMLSVLPIGGLLVKGGSLAPEHFITIIILSVAMITPLITCMSYADDIGMMRTITNEVREMLDLPEMNRPETLAPEQTPRDHRIVLRDVRFKYQQTEILHGINMEIPEGAFIALVGPSGSGKSTIGRLIASLWDVGEGSITLGGTDIRAIPTEYYSDRIAYVSQDNFLFNQSIRDNIRMGKTGAPATDQEVEEAARMSGCHDFIIGLEDGYDTIVGDSGGHLSGGERQRISIARAMLKNAPIVILDEATAYTDPENEALIQNSVARLVKGKTLIVIAHRLSTVKDADQLYVINDGKVEEHGTHQELLAHHGLYQQMWEAHISVKDSSEEIQERQGGVVHG